MHYTPNVDFAFNSVEHIMRDVNNGWIIRYTHANVASFFFIFVYMHHQPIGIFDSGFGGLTVFKSIIEQLPEYDYIYLGDNARAPTLHAFRASCARHRARRDAPSSPST